ncbi:hypothetical protein [Rathayibacter sp. VKM Ac-2630]|nr:hypothetical protein [Rathayibacter sp. VKM Ac-2630]
MTRDLSDRTIIAGLLVGVFGSAFVIAGIGVACWVIAAEMWT